MVIFSGGPGQEQHWQGDGVDVEVQQCPGMIPPVWQWTLYDQDRMVTTGVSRSAMRAQWAGWWRSIRYRLLRT